MAENHIKVVAFDAVGTLIYPQPSIAEAYVDIAQRHGSNLTKDEIKSRFSRAFGVFDRDNEANDFRTSEVRERELWQEVVGTVLTDVDDLQACFDELFEWFASVKAWRPFDDVGETCQTLNDLGVGVAIASNFDSRLHALCDGLEALTTIRVRCISSEVGYRKPSRDYYRALATMCGCDRSEILMVGDTPANDVEGAMSAGIRAVLIDRAAEPDLPNRISSLEQIVQLVSRKQSTSADIHSNRVDES